MTTKNKQSGDADNQGQKYGDQRRKWSPEFAEYMEAIVRHPNFRGMPDSIDEEGVIRWNAPSNRPPGRWQDLHDRRLNWWKKRAKTLGIATVGGWISKTAKRNHPFGEKPCQTCGHIRRLEYVYPTKKTIKRLNAELPKTEQLVYEDLKTIYEVIKHVLKKPRETLGLDLLTKVFPELDAAERDGVDFVNFMRDEIVPSEPKGRLSPGSMSNAPDRLDGFHSYNLCCRPKQDTGRSKENLRTYSDDRRAFEYWCEGDWAAANLLMTLGGEGKCPECGREAKMTADHIGPISLGFTHRPRFRPLCSSCNSTKGNRLSFADVNTLLADEGRGDKVASFHIGTLWNAIKSRVKNAGDAKKLSNLLRINQHYYLEILAKIYQLGYPDILLNILGADFAQEKIAFIGLDASSFRYKSIVKTKRADTYSDSKACRAVKIGFEALEDYSRKEKRNIHDVPEKVLAKSREHLLASLPPLNDSNGTFRKKLVELLRNNKMEEKQKLQALSALFEGNFSARGENKEFQKALRGYLEAIGKDLLKRF